jgi:hypothetical protein
MEHGRGNWPLNYEWAGQRQDCSARQSLYEGVGKAAGALATGCQPLLVIDHAAMT